MKKKLLITIIVLAFSTISLRGQNTHFTAVSQPFKYKAPYEGMKLTKVYSEDSISGDTWIVFSDRDNNSTYLSPGGKPSNKKASFMQFFYVVEENNDWIHIVKDDRFDNLNIRFSNKMEDYHWIEKKKMLLGRMSMVKSIISKLSLKAMIINSPNLTEKNFDQINLAKFYNQPNLQQENSNTSRLFKIFYIYKISKKGYLLGKTSGIAKPRDVKKNIQGWVNKDKVLIWDNRLAIEPNFDPAEAEKRKQHGIKAAVFLQEDVAYHYKKTGDNTKAFWDNDSYEIRNNGNWIRFPYLRYNEKYDLMNVVTLGKLVKSNHVIVMTAEQKAKIDKTIEKLTKQLKQLNIIFVVDATTSMGDYFPPIQNAIKTTVEYLKNTHQSDNIEFAALAYRDYPEGELLTRSCPLGSYQNVIDFINTVKAGDDSDRDTREALFYGLNKAIRGIDINDKATNLVILIGDAGNNTKNDIKYNKNNEINKNNIIKTMSSYNCHFLAFQVHNEGTAYDDFNEEVKDIMFSMNLNSYKSISSTLGQKVNPPYKSNTEKSGMHLFTVKNPLYYSKLYYFNSSKGNKFKLDPDILQGEIEKGLKDIKEMQNTFLQTLQNIKDGKGLPAVMPHPQGKVADGEKRVDDYNGIIINYLRKLQGMDDHLLSKAFEKSFQFYYKGYTPKRVIIEGDTLNLYKYMLLMSNPELSDLKRTLEKLNRASNANQQRDILIEIWDEVLGKFSGEDKMKTTGKNWGELMSILYGLPKNTYHGLLGKFTKPQILQADGGVIKKYSSQIEIKAESINSIFNEGSNYEFSFMVLNQPYYWIDVNYLP